MTHQGALFVHDPGRGGGGGGIPYDGPYGEAPLIQASGISTGRDLTS